MTPRILALDPATRRTGLCRPDGSTDTLICPAKLAGDDRLDWWWHSFNIVIHDLQPTRIVYESPFIGPHVRSGLALVELHVKLRDVIRRHGIVHTAVPPSTLKKAATGNGNTGKEQMMIAARRLGWKGDGDDEGDAYLLWWGAREGWWG